MFEKDSLKVIVWLIICIGLAIASYIAMEANSGDTNLNIATASCIFVILNRIIDWKFEDWVDIPRLMTIKQSSLNEEVKTDVTNYSKGTGSVGLASLSRNILVRKLFVSITYIDDSIRYIRRSRNNQLINIFISIGLVCFFVFNYDDTANKEINYLSLFPVFTNVLIIWLPLIQLKNRNESLT